MTWELATILIGGIASLGIYSFFLGENYFYRFFEHLFIGIAAGLLPLLTIKEFLWPNIVTPMIGASITTFPDGTLSEPYSFAALLYLVPLGFGLLYYTLYIPKISWLAKLVIGFSLGYTAGLSFKGFFAEMMPQFASSFKPLIVVKEGVLQIGSSINNIVFIFTLFSVMYYFFFSIKGKRPVFERVSKAGRLLMMVCFGAFFGSTIMARMALLVERIQFLLDPWWNAVKQVVT